jgi:hypothetical protein
LIFLFIGKGLLLFITLLLSLALCVVFFCLVKRVISNNWFISGVRGIPFRPCLIGRDVYAVFLIRWLILIAISLGGCAFGIGCF